MPSHCGASGFSVQPFLAKLAVSSHTKGPARCQVGREMRLLWMGQFSGVLLGGIVLYEAERREGFGETLAFPCSWGRG